MFNCWEQYLHGRYQSLVINFFSKAVSQETKANLSVFLGVEEVKEYEKYLGLPVVVGKNKKASFNCI